MEHPVLVAFLVVIGIAELVEGLVRLSDCGEFALIIIIGGFLTLGAAGWLADDQDLPAEIESALAVIIPLAAIYYWNVPLGCAI